MAASPDALAPLLADALEEALLVLDDDGSLVFVSCAAGELLDAGDADSLAGLLARVATSDRDGVRDLLSRPPAAPARRRFRVERDGAPARPLELQVRPVPGGHLARLRDVVLPSSDPAGALEQIARHLHDVLWLVDVPGERLLYVSPGFESLFRRSRQSLLAGPAAFYDAVHEADRERLAKTALEGVETGFVAEFRIDLPEGGVRWVRHRSVPLRGGDGSTLTAGITTDIDEHHRSETARRDAERRFAVLCGDVFETMSEIDASGRVVWTTTRSGGSFAPPDPRDPRARTDLIHPEDHTRATEVFGSALRERRRATHEFRAADETGAWRWLETTLHPFRSDDGELRGLFVSRDISERRALLQRLRESEERFRLLADHAHDLITEHDSRGRMLWANRRAIEASGYTFEEMTASPPMEKMHPEDRERIAPRIWGLERSGGALFVTFRSRHADGSWRWYEANLHAYTTASGDPRLVSVARDVTDRKQAEDRLRESEERHRQLVEQSPEGIVVHAEGRVLYANPAALRLVGASDGETLAERPLSELLDTRPVDSGAPHELRLRRLDGSRCELMVSHSAIHFDGRRAVQTMLRDITEWRVAERERERLAEQLREARKLESLGVLAGGIAHDFNNLLAVILGNVNFTRRHVRGDEEVGAALSDAVDAGESAARLTRQLLAYAGRRAPEVRPVDLSEHVREVQGLLEAALPKKVELRFELAEPLRSVRADVVQLEQVTMNLVRNAAEAIGEREGCVTVSTGAARVEAGDVRTWATGDELPPGEYAYLEVSDDGAGMDEETRRRIFDPFFTTKPSGHGLGLSAVLGLVRGHGGGIDLRSEPGRGTSFRILLPASEPASGQGAAGPADAPAPAAPGRARVLVVDDEPGVRRMLRRLLEARGCAVEEAEDGLLAVERCRERADAFDVVILDLNMPRAGGEETLRRLRELSPALPVLLSSGDDQARLAERVAADPHTSFISKPYRETELLERIAALAG